MPQEGPAAGEGGEHLVQVGIIDRGGGRDAPAQVGHRDAAVPEAAHEVHRAVDGVDDKDLRRVQIVVAVVLLAEKARLRDRRGKALHQQGLHPSVVFGDDVAVPALALAQNAGGVQHEGGGLPLGRAEQRQDLVIVHGFPPCADRLLHYSRKSARRTERRRFFPKMFRPCT